MVIRSGSVRQPALLLLLLIPFILASCTDGSDPAGPPDVSLQVSYDDRVEQLLPQIEALFRPPVRHAVATRLQNIARDVGRGREAAAEAKLLAILGDLVEWFENGRLLDPNGDLPPTTEEAVAALIADLFRLAGLPAPTVDPAALGNDGAVAIVGPSGGLVVTGTEFAGVDIPAGAFAGPTFVTIARLPDPTVPGTGPLPTTLDQYPLFYDIWASRTPLVPVTVGVCVLEDPPEPLGAPSAIFPQLRLAHPDPQNPLTVEILPLANVPFLNCTNAVAGPAPNVVRRPGAIGTALLDLRDAVLEPVAALFGPRDLHASAAAAAMRGRGLGGLATSFSPFGAVDPGSQPTSTIAYVANLVDGTVSVIDVATETVTGMIPVGSNPSQIAFSPDGSTAYLVNSVSHDVSVVDVATQSLTNTIPVGTNPSSVAFSPDGSTAYVVNQGSGDVSVIDVATQTVTSTIPVGNLPVSVAFSPDGSIAYVTRTQVNPGDVAVVDVSTETVTSTINVGVTPVWVAFTPTGTAAYVVNFSDNSVSVVDVSSGTVTGTIPVGSGPTSAAFTPDGLTAYVTNSSGNTVSVIDVATGTLANTIVVVDRPNSVAFTADGSKAYVVGSLSNDVSVIDVATGTVTNTVGVGSFPASVAFRP